MDIACIVSKEGHLELKTASPFISDPKEFVGSSTFASFPTGQTRLIFNGLSVPQLWITYWAGDKLLHVHIHLFQISAQVSRNFKAVCRHISATPSLQVRPSAHMQSLVKTDQVQVEKEHKTSVEKTSAGVGSAGKESHVFILTKLTLPCSSLWFWQTW